MSSLGTAVPAGRFCVFYATRRINNLLILTIYFAVFHSAFAFKYFWLVEVTYLLIRFIKTRFFPWNTKNTDRYGVNKENTHTHTTHSQKDNIEKG